jgi:septum formation protein
MNADTLQALDCVVIGCDTVVAIDEGEIAYMLAKPEDEHEAKAMLRRLSAKRHSVFTGVAIVSQWWNRNSEEYEITRRVTSVETEVQFRALTPEMIEWYVATGEPFDKAGGYGIQGHASVFVEDIYGDFFNVVGLPIHTVAGMLEDLRIEWWRGPSALE